MKPRTLSALTNLFAACVAVIWLLNWNGATCHVSLQVQETSKLLGQIVSLLCSLVARLQSICLHFPRLPTPVTVDEDLPEREGGIKDGLQVYNILVFYVVVSAVAPCRQDTSKPFQHPRRSWVVCQGIGSLCAEHFSITTVAQCEEMLLPCSTLKIENHWPVPKQAKVKQGTFALLLAAPDLLGRGPSTAPQMSLWQSPAFWKRSKLSGKEMRLPASCPRQPSLG